MARPEDALLATEVYKAHRGLKIEKNLSNGFTVAWLHYSADPTKDEKWAEKERKTYQDMETWNREMEIDFASTTGVKVYPMFRRDIHSRPLVRIPNRTIWRGWDFGFGHPAVVWAQVGDNGALYVLREHMGFSTTIQVFAQEVLEISEREFPGHSWFDAGDPSVRQVNDKSERTSADILRQDYKIRIQSRKQGIKPSVNLVRSLLLPDRHGLVRLFVDDHLCPVLTEGFMGGYGLDDADDPEPIKDGYYDHLQDSLRYLTMVLFDSVKAQLIRPGKVVDYARSEGRSFTGY